MDDLLAGRYERRQMLGRGAMGEVWLAMDQRLGRLVAIKKLNLDAASTADLAAVARIEREARVAAQLHHVNVAAVYDLLEEKSTHYLVMEYVEGLSLAQRIRELGRLPLEEAALLIAQVADGLEAAHSRGIVHRDVKPANILITPDNVAKLVDFGIARGVGDAMLTQPGQLIGTVAFMAPEVAQGARASGASDIWSLGATLFAAVEGHSPFDVAQGPRTTSALLMRLVNDPPPLPLHGGTLTRILGRMMARDETKRPMAAAVASELRTIAAPDREVVDLIAPIPPRHASQHLVPPPPVPGPPVTSPPFHRWSVNATREVPAPTPALAESRRPRPDRLAIALGVLGVLAIAAAVTAVLISRHHGNAGASTVSSRSARTTHSPSPLPASTATTADGRVTATASGNAYDVRPVADDVVTDCAAHSFGAARAQFAAAPCVTMIRRLFTTTIRGRAVLVSTVVVQFDAARAVGAANAASLADLENSPTYGGVLDLLTEGAHVPGFAGSRFPPNETFLCVAIGAETVVIDAAFEAGPNDAAPLRALVHDLLSTRLVTGG